MDKQKWIAFAKKIDGISDWTGRVFCWLVIPADGPDLSMKSLPAGFGCPHDLDLRVEQFFLWRPFHAGRRRTDSCTNPMSASIYSSCAARKERLQILDLICYFLLFFPFIIVILYHGIVFAKDSWAIWETSWSTWAPPLYPIKTVIPVTAFLLLLQGISEVIKKIIFLKTGEEI